MMWKAPLGTEAYGVHAKRKESGSQTTAGDGAAQASPGPKHSVQGAFTRINESGNGDAIYLPCRS